MLKPNENRNKKYKYVYVLLQENSCGMDILWIRDKNSTIHKSPSAKTGGLFIFNQCNQKLNKR